MKDDMRSAALRGSRIRARIRAFFSGIAFFAAVVIVALYERLWLGLTWED